MTHKYAWPVCVIPKNYKNSIKTFIYYFLFNLAIWYTVYRLFGLQQAL